EEDPRIADPRLYRGGAGKVGTSVNFLRAGIESRRVVAVRNAPFSERNLLLHSRLHNGGPSVSARRAADLNDEAHVRLAQQKHIRGLDLNLVLLRTRGKVGRG